MTLSQRLSNGRFNVFSTILIEELSKIDSVITKELDSIEEKGVREYIFMHQYCWYWRDKVIYEVTHSNPKDFTIEEIEEYIASMRLLSVSVIEKIQKQIAFSKTILPIKSFGELSQKIKGLFNINNTGASLASNDIDDNNQSKPVPLDSSPAADAPNDFEAPPSEDEEVRKLEEDCPF